MPDPTARAMPLSGHQIASAQLAKHGLDRFPTPGRQLGQLIREVGELAEAMDIGHGLGDVITDEMRAEYADVGLSLYELGNKLGIDLINAMSDLVATDGRRFAGPDGGKGDG